MNVGEKRFYTGVTLTFFAASLYLIYDGIGDIIGTKPQEGIQKVAGSLLAAVAAVTALEKRLR